MSEQVGNRSKQFKRNVLLEGLLRDLNDGLEVAELKQMAAYSGKKMTYPAVLVMGPLRSGTTLFTQWLANTGMFAYPTNLLSRFYQAPILGAKIQLLLTDPRFNFRDELGEFVQQSEYISENGKTKGVLAPNEFWYFWRRFLAEPSRDVWTDEELQRTMHVQTMKAELIGMMDVFQKPFAAKGMLFNYNIPFLDVVLDKVLFVQVKRDPLMNIQSVLGARERQLGSRDAWYSFDIPEKEALMKLSAVEQAAGQVACINKAVEHGLSRVSNARKLVVQYEDFCASPKPYFHKMVECMHQQGVQIEGDYSGETQFLSRNKLHLSEADKSLAEQTYQIFYRD